MSHILVNKLSWSSVLMVLPVHPSSITSVPPVDVWTDAFTPSVALISFPWYTMILPPTSAAYDTPCGSLHRRLKPSLLGTSFRWLTSRLTSLCPLLSVVISSPAIGVATLTGTRNPTVDAGITNALTSLFRNCPEFLLPTSEDGGNCVLLVTLVVTLVDTGIDDRV